jgi:peptidyl-prolyl cis-trans isomerase C
MGRYSRTKNSTKIFLAATLVAAVIFGVSQLFFCCNGSGDVVAKVNGTKIYKSQIEHKLSVLLGGFQTKEVELPAISSLPKEVIEILAKEVYLDDELAKIAKKSDATKTDKVQQQIREAKNAVLRQAYMDSLIAESTTDEKISQKYSELSSELASKKEYLLSHIVVKTKEEAEKLAKDLERKGRYSTTFAYVAKKYSLDKESAVDGGNLGFVLESNLIKEIADVVLKMEKDQISQPIETKFGWHIVKLSDIRDAKAMPFDEVKENIRQQIVKDILESTKEEIIKDAKVEILLKEEAKKESKEEEKVEGETANVKPKKSDEIAPLDDAASEEKVEEKNVEKQIQE